MSIVLEGVTKRFGAQRVVEDVSLEIADGELFVLLGASGSGKSTILRLVAGLVAADRGRITIDGRDVTALPPQARGTGFVFQNYSLFRHMTVGENVEFGLRLRKVPAAERAERREVLLAQVELAGLADRMPDQLSGGQRQRVALARALAYAPSVLLLDEPFGALDAKIRIQLRRSLRELQDDLGVTTVLVTHDQEEAFELADRLAIVDRGRLVEVGTPEDLYARPRTLFAATFLGSGAVLGGTAADGALRIGSASLLLTGPSTTVPSSTLPIPSSIPTSIPPAAPVAAKDGTPVQVLIRPEHVRLHADRPDAVADAVILGQGEVVETTFVGAQRRLRIRLPRPPGCRQLAPKAAFGTTGLLLDAVVPSDATFVGSPVWVAVRGWHVLTAALPHILWVVPPVDRAGRTDGGDDVDAASLPAVPPIVDALVRALGARVRLLAVAGPPARSSAARARLDGLAHVLGAGDHEPVVRHGDAAAVIAAEQRSTDFELTIVPPTLRDGAAPGDGVDDAVRAVLDTAHGPVLVWRNDGPLRGRVLICTAAGEPGKGDVEVGGRIAARLGAAVTLLYVRVDGRGPKAAGHHLDRAAAALADRGLACTVQQRDAASALGGIQAELRAEAYDLVVIGHHVPAAGTGAARDDVTAQVLTASDVSVLVVPDTSGR